ncbi:hypothetical protein VOLCADRAFT_32503, partial [Volvox carteri f. nagariensis]
QIIHRDIKPANLLLDDAGVLKLCDFGSARSVNGCQSPNRGQIPFVTTRWYRPPEVITSTLYGYAADVWSFGCTVAELASGRPLLPGSSDADQMIRIMK